MHPDLAQLVILQTHDLEAKHLRDEIAALPKHIAALETKAKATVGQRAVVLDLIAKEDALRRSQESDIADLRQKIARTQKKIDLATTTVQVTALEHEAAFAKVEIARIEDAELESMERSRPSTPSANSPTQPLPRLPQPSNASVPAPPKPSPATRSPSPKPMPNAMPFALMSSSAPPAKPPSPPTTASPAPRAPPSPRPSTSSAPHAR